MLQQSHDKQPIKLTHALVNINNLVLVRKQDQWVNASKADGDAYPVNLDPIYDCAKENSVSSLTYENDE